MNLILKQPAWAAALWMLLLSRCNDGPTNAATAAAFAPQYQNRHHQQQLSSNTPLTKHNNKRKRTFNDLTGSTREDQVALVLHSTTVNTVEEMTRIKLDNPYPVASITRIHLPYLNTNANNKKKNDWTKLVPAPISRLNDSEKRLDDVRIEWGPEDDLTQVAQSMLESFPVPQGKQPDMVDYLAECLETFQDFCTDQFIVDETSADAIQGFRARIVCTRGSSGTKCPKWHVDHVPIRWIQSLVGPGCDYIESSDTSVEEWHQLKQLLLEQDDDDDDDDDQDKLFDIPGPSHLQGHHAKEFQAILLAGNRWNEFSKQPHPFVPPVLHKSPKLPFWQGRVLLTMDVIAPQPPLD